jgi:hypothetical protein
MLLNCRLSINAVYYIKTNQNGPKNGLFTNGIVILQI